MGEIVNATIAKSANSIKLTWTDLSYSVKISKGCLSSKKTQEMRIVKGVSGYAAPGTVTYILGSSGAGKTSLLDCLCKRRNPKVSSTTEGEVMINDTKLESSS